MLQSKGNRRSFVHLIHDVCEVKASYLGSRPHKQENFSKRQKKLQGYIWLSSLIYLPIKPACCYVRYTQLAYGGTKSPTCP